MRSARFELVTRRLVIRQLDAGLAGSIHAGSLDEDNRWFMPDEVFESAEEASAAIRQLMAFYETMDGPLVYAVFLKDNTHIGHVEAVPMDGGRWEVGYHIIKAFTGCGFATEAVAAFVPVILRRLRISLIEGNCDARNTASCRVLEKCGFSLVFDGIAVHQGRRAAVRKHAFTQACPAP